jgi:hypothetical protein
MRKIKYTVNADGKVSPVARQWGGTQGEHNATEIIFDFSALYENFATEGWRIDFDSADAGFDPGGTIRPLLLENVISRAIPQKYTKNGGEMTAILVGTESAPDGSETVRIVCSIPVTIYFTEAERHEETEGQVVESLSEMERNVLQAAEAATEHIDAAEQRTLETVADIQQKLDNGDFIGEKGDPFTYEDFTEEQLADLKGEPGDDYVLTEADKSDIAKLINVDNKQDKFADVTERDGAVILTSTVSDDRPPQAILKNGELELGAMLLKFGDGQGEVSLNGLNAPDDSLNINANDNRIRNVADPIFDKDAVNKKYFERNLPSVDQTYTPESTNAQSGIAVAEAIASANNNTTKEEVLQYINTKSYPSQLSFAYTESDVYTGYWCYVGGTIEGGVLSVEWDETKLTKIQTIVYLLRNGEPYKYIQSSAGGTSLEGDNATANWIDAGTGAGFPFAYPFKLQIPEGCIPMVCMRSTNAVLPQGSPYSSIEEMGADAQNLIAVSVSKEFDNDITKKLDIEQGEGKANRILTTDSTGKIVAVNIDPKSTEMRPYWDTVIHRGWVNGAKENTIPAFYLAKENGYDWVECDVRITADEQLVIWHDATVSGTNLSGQNTTLTIAQSTLNDLQSLVLETHERFGKIKISTLDELLKMARCLGMKVLIEAKVSNQSALEKIARTVLRCGMSKNVVYLLGNATYCGYISAIDKNASFDILANPTAGGDYSSYTELLNGSNTVTFDINAVTWDFNEATIQEINAAGIGLSFWNVLHTNITKCIDAGALRITKHNQDDATDLNAIYFRSKTFW